MARWKDITGDKIFDRWRAHLYYHLPSLAKRVFALRDFFYTGCGFHYDLEAELGYVIAKVNAHNEFYPSEIRDRIVMQVRIRRFLESLRWAEANIISLP